MFGVIKEIAQGIPGVFLFHGSIKPLPAPVGIEVVDEADDVVYLVSELDKWSMRRDRLNVVSDMKTAINEAKHGQASKTN